MPQYGLRYIKAAPYQFDGDAVSYGTAVKVGDAMTATLEPERAEDSLYAEDGKAEFISEMVGGAIGLGVKYILAQAYALLLGAETDTRQISYVPAGATEPVTRQIAGQKLGPNSLGNYVGVAFCSPDLVDHANKYFCMFVRKTRFGPPGLSLQTKNNSIQFQTPTITGQFLRPDDGEEFYAWALVDDLAAAKAWVDGVFVTADEEPDETDETDDQSGGE